MITTDYTALQGPKSQFLALLETTIVSFHDLAYPGDGMNYRPSFQFYPADWIKAPDLQICSANTQGVWMNLLCRMHEAKEEGILRGTAAELARLTGFTLDEFQMFLKEAKERGFCDLSEKVGKKWDENGTKCPQRPAPVPNLSPVFTIKCRRMNRLFLERETAKEKKRRQRKESVPILSPPLSRNCPAPSSSSSSKEYIYNPSNKENYDKFWMAYPRKVGNRKAWGIWQKLNPPEPLVVKILTAIEQQSKSEQWLQDGGKFIPFPAKWLEEQKWDDILKSNEPPKPKYVN